MSTAGLMSVGAGLAIVMGPEAVPIWLRAASGSMLGLLKVLWNTLTKEAGATGGTAAQQLSVSQGLVQVLSGANTPVPRAGRIVQRPGQDRGWELSRINLSGKNIGPKPGGPPQDPIFIHNE